MRQRLADQDEIDALGTDPGPAGPSHPIRSPLSTNARGFVHAGEIFNDDIVLVPVIVLRQHTIRALVRCFGGRARGPGGRRRQTCAVRR